ncbi:hypothetical protein C2S52_012529 [Perilla frutescens var. hirtella]|nr:hypothetical protein C2S52_012529 [Perilla frutescens var. hirtella]
MGKERTGPLSFHCREREGWRCSVKPAWRSALHSKSHEACAFAQATLPNSQLGMGGPELAPQSPVS